MYCSKCGAEMKESDTFCPKCGHKVGENGGFGNITIRKPTFSKGFKLAMAVILGIAALGLVGIIISNVAGKPGGSGNQVEVATAPTEAPTDTGFEYAVHVIAKKMEVVEKTSNAVSFSISVRFMNTGWHSHLGQNTL